MATALDAVAEPSQTETAIETPDPDLRNTRHRKHGGSPPLPTTWTPPPPPPPPPTREEPAEPPSAKPPDPAEGRAPVKGWHLAPKPPSRWQRRKQRQAAEEAARLERQRLEAERREKERKPSCSAKPRKPHASNGNASLKRNGRNGSSRNGTGNGNRNKRNGRTSVSVAKTATSTDNTPTTAHTAGTTGRNCPSRGKWIRLCPDSLSIPPSDVSGVGGKHSIYRVAECSKRKVRGAQPSNFSLVT